MKRIKELYRHLRQAGEISIDIEVKWEHLALMGVILVLLVTFLLRLLFR